MIRLRRVRRQIQGREHLAQEQPRKPKRRDTRLVCLPIHPVPARMAMGFSITGAVSTNTLTSHAKVSAIQRPAAFRRVFITLW